MSIIIGNQVCLIESRVLLTTCFALLMSELIDMDLYLKLIHVFQESRFQGSRLCSELEVCVFKVSLRALLKHWLIQYSG